METERTELVQVESAIEACNGLAVPDPIRQSLVRDLRPVADRLAQYAEQAAASVVTDQESADEATRVCVAIAADIASIKTHEVLAKITDGLHKLHRRWTGLRDIFVEPLERDRKLLKTKIIAWQEAERQKAEELQRRLQAEADAKAAREREALLKKAAALKTPEKQEALREQAAATIAPTIQVEAPKTAVRVQRIVTCEVVAITKFVAHAAKRPELCGYIDKDALAQALRRAKIANPMFEADGVVFGTKIV